MATNIRDLVEDWNPPADPTLRDVAKSAVTERTRVADPHEKVRGLLPGDEQDHLLYQETHNPMPELGGPIQLFKALQAGQVPPSKIRAVKAYLAAARG
jgi:hypothetical protein